MHAAALALPSRSILALTLLLTLGAPAQAADPETTATRTLLTRQTAARNTFRSALKSANAEASVAIAALEAALAASGNTTAAGDTLFTALRAFQADVAAALDQARLAQAGAARDALATLGSALDGVYPESFYPGDRSPTAILEESVRKDMEKTYAKLGKRLGKTAARFRAAGFSFGFRVRPPGRLPTAVWNEGFVGGVGGFVPTIDLALSWSELDVLGDGQLRIAGGSSDLMGTLVASTENEPPQIVDVNTFAERFSTSFSNAALREGVWLIYGFGAQPAVISIGIR